MMDDDNRYIEQRREKLTQLRQQGQAYPNHFERRHLAGELHAQYADSSKPELEELALQVQLAGRMIDAGSHLQGVLVGARPGRHDQEILDVDPPAGVCAAAD